MGRALVCARGERPHGADCLGLGPDQAPRRRVCGTPPASQSHQAMSTCMQMWQQHDLYWVVANQRARHEAVDRAPDVPSGCMKLCQLTDIWHQFVNIALVMRFPSVQVVLAKLMAPCCGYSSITGKSEHHCFDIAASQVWPTGKTLLRRRQAALTQAWGMEARPCLLTRRQVSACFSSAASQMSPLSKKLLDLRQAATQML